jgi:hypothetical protein
MYIHIPLELVRYILTFGKLRIVNKRFVNIKKLLQIPSIIHIIRENYSYSYIQLYFPGKQKDLRLCFEKTSTKHIFTVILYTTLLHPGMYLSLSSSYILTDKEKWIKDW